MLVKTVRELLKQGHDPVALPMSRSGELLEELEATGAKLQWITENVKDLGFFKPRLVRELRRVIRQEKPDVVHLCDIISGHMGRLACIGLGVPVVYHIRSVVPHDKLKYRLAAKALSFATDTYIAVSRAAASRCVSPDNWTRKPVEILYNAIDAEAMQGAEEADLAGLVRPSGSVVAMVGRLVKLKNADLVIRAMAVLKERLPECSLLIVGDGPEKKQLMELATDLGLTESVVFAGVRHDVPGIMKALSKRRTVLVMPSAYEGFGAVVLEALFMGIPAVVSPFVPAVEISGKAIQVTSLEVAALADGMEDTLKDGARYRELRRESIAVASSHTMEAYVQRLLEIYGRIA